MPSTPHRDAAKHAAARAAALPSSPATAPPRQVTSFVGREALLAELRDLLTREDVRLLTLTGPGGVGKTRLATELAGMPEIMPGTVWFLSLAAVPEPTLVGATIAHALALSEEPGRPTEEMLADAFDDVPGLLILDNFEQVVDAAPLVATLLARCPLLKVLVTSRTPLHLSVEHIYPVPPLSLARDDAEAVRLFIERARQALPDYDPSPDEMATIRHICERLHGLPLAIELAASRVSDVPLEAVFSRLSQGTSLLEGSLVDASGRHRTMRGAIEWSYGLLTPESQALLRRLSVFVGGASLTAVERIAAWPPAVDDAGTLAVDLLGALVDHSLVSRVETTPDSAEPRFEMQEIIREFALERLAAHGEEEAARQAHAATCLALAEEGERHLIHEVEPAWIDRLEADHANFRVALGWCLREDAGPDQITTGVRLAGSLWLFWYYHSHLLEGRDWLERALAMPGELPERERARAFVGLGTLQHFLGDQTEARATLLGGLRLLRRLGDLSGMAYALTGLGNVARDAGFYDEATEAFTEANTLFSALGDRVNVAVTGYHLGVVAVGQGNLPLATERIEASLALSRSLGDPWNTAASLSYLGLVRSVHGQPEAAASALREALELFQQIGTTERIVDVLRRVAVLSATRHRHEAALRLFAAADAIAARIGVGQGLPEREIYRRELDRAARRVPRTQRAGIADLALQDAIAEAERQLDAALAGPVQDSGTETAGAELSERERQVLRLMAAGKSDQEIAETLGISRRTVTTHAGHIYTKLGVTTRTAAAAWAARHGLS